MREGAYLINWGEICPVAHCFICFTARSADKLLWIHPEPWLGKSTPDSGILSTACAGTKPAPLAHKLTLTEVSHVHVFTGAVPVDVRICQCGVRVIASNTYHLHKKIVSQ